MSAVDLLGDVIDEIHRAENVLGPDDIPDHIIFKHYRNLWQVLLGIEATAIDSSNYELFEIEFAQKSEVFRGFTYFGPNIGNAISNKDNAVGSVEESLRNVYLLDQQSDDVQQDTSLSFKLSMFNKIRYLLYLHGNMVKDLLDETTLITVIASYLKDDVLAVKSSLGVSLKTNNNTFNLCYREAVDILANEDNHMSFSGMSEVLLQTFKTDFNVAYFFNPKIILKYQHQIIDIIKRIFKDHQYVDIEIDNYFQYDPIFPILKPIFRNLALKTLHDQGTGNIDEDEESDVDSVKKELDNELLVEILRNVTNMELEEYITDVPVTMKLFYRIVQSYIESLKKDGESDIENDLYIILIKKAVMKWVDGMADTKHFLSQLTDLSLVPTAKPYIFQNVKFPTLNMRMALYQVKEDLRIYEKYYNLWRNLYVKKGVLAAKSQHWKTNRIKHFFQLWRKKVKKVSDLEYIDISGIELIQKRYIFDKLKAKHDSFQNSLFIFLDIRKGLHLDTLQQKYEDIKEMYFTADKHYNATLHKIYWTKLMLSKFAKLPKIHEQFLIKQKKIYFNAWHIKSQKVQNCQTIANNFLSKMLLMKYYKKIKEKTNPMILHIKSVEQKCDKYIYHKFFHRMQYSLQLIKIEKKVTSYVNNNILKKTFLKLRRVKEVNDISRKRNSENSETIKKKYFNVWERKYGLAIKAKDFEKKVLLKKQYKIIKLKLLEQKFKEARAVKTKEYIIKIWKLKVITLVFEQEKCISVVENYFKKWHSKTLNIQAALKSCSKDFSQILIAIYFDSMLDRFEKIKHLKIQGENFKTRRQIINDQLLKSRVFERVKSNCHIIKMREADLREIEMKFQHDRTFRFFIKMKNRVKDLNLLYNRADEAYTTNLLLKYYNIWYDKFEHVMDINNVLESKLDTQNVELLTKCMSVLQLKLIKIRTSESNIKNFVERWDRSRKLIFFKIWKLKLQNRKSPTPTARKLDQSNTQTAGAIPDLNPYVDLGPKDRGSPVFRPRLRSKMRSLITGDSSQYSIEERVDDDSRSLLQTPNNSETSVLASYRTPVFQRSGYSSLSNKDSTSVTLRSVERIRKKALEERMNMYSELRKPISLNNIMEEKLETNELYNGGFLFGTIDQDVVDTNTPVKRS